MHAFSLSQTLVRLLAALKIAQCSHQTNQSTQMIRCDWQLSCSLWGADYFYFATAIKGIKDSKNPSKTMSMA